MFMMVEYPKIWKNYLGKEKDLEKYKEKFGMDRVVVRLLDDEEAINKVIKKYLLECTCKYHRQFEEEAE